MPSPTRRNGLLRTWITWTVVAAALAATLACGHKTDPATARAPAPGIATGPAHDSVQMSRPAAPPDVPSGTERHTHLKGAQTEAICTSLADVQAFYTAGQDPTQESLSCSMIFGGKNTSDVAVLATQGAFVHVRLYNKSGHFSEGYMRAQALQ
jgi:hypothetical protein